MEHARPASHNGAMISFLHRRAMRRRAAVVLCTSLMFLLGLPSGAIAQTNEAAGTASDVRIVSVDFEATDALERWLGGEVRGDATVTVTNDGTAPVIIDDGRVFANGRTHLLPTIDLAPGQSAAVSTSLDLGGLSFLERDIIVTAGGAQTQTVHRSIPWLLVAFVGFAVNSALLAARDLLRRRVRRQLAAVRA